MDRKYHYERYQTQVALKELGEKGQEKLSLAKVLVVGAGGLGCPALQYLAGAGIGKIGIIDDDIVSLSNLHRQVLFGVNDIGKYKVDAAAKQLKELNPEIIYPIYKERLDNRNALAIIEPYDIIIDGTDNLTSKYVINDACLLLNKPFIYGGISGYEGQVALFNVNNNSANYRDLFPQLPEEASLDCNQQGVLGMLPGIIGCMQATEAIKWIAGIGKTTCNTIFNYNMLEQKIYSFSLSHHLENQTPAPANPTAFKSYNYDIACNTDEDERYSIDIVSFEELRLHKNTMVIDLRQLDELPLLYEFEHLKIPEQILYNQAEELPYEEFILLCQTGKRSLLAAKKLRAIFKNRRKVFSLQGGILQWKKYASNKK